MDIGEKIDAVIGDTDRFETRGNSKKGKPRSRPGAGFIILIIAAWFVWSCVAYVPAGSEGVRINSIYGGVQPIALSGGTIHFKLSAAESVVPMETRTQKFDVSTTASSSDLQDVSTDITLNYHIMGGSAPKIYRDVGLDYKDRVIMPAIQESTKAATAQYNAAALITERPRVKANITDNIRARLQAYDIVVEQVSITNFNFSTGYSQAIEAKQVAEQNAEKASRDLDRIQIEANQTITQATAKAAATKLQGDAEAYAVTKLGDAIKSNPEVYKLKWVERWNGEPPFYVAGDSGNMFMLNTATK